MSLPLIDRPPTPLEVEKLRLVLSTYQDGSGQLAYGQDLTLPGWRDFERSVAFVFRGRAQESKAIFDVLIPDPDNPNVNYGLSCKMRETLRFLQRTGRITIEVSNSAGKFWRSISNEGLGEQSYEADPSAAGACLIRLVESWYEEVSIRNKGNVDTSKSYYLALQWDRRSGVYQLFQISISLPAPESLEWVANGRRLLARDQVGTVLEWYGYSGGQLKYYPFAESAIWSSVPFKLEPLQAEVVEHNLLRKVREYFPVQWERIADRVEDNGL